MKRMAAALIVSLVLPAVGGAPSDYDSAKRKFDLIEKERVRPGSTVSLSSRELNAYVEHEIPAIVPQGVRDPRLVLGDGSATGSAIIDFLRIRRAQGKPPSWLMRQLLQGEHPVTVTATIDSGGGHATVNVTRVEISGVEIEGGMLDFLIRTFVLPIFPGARVGEPFDLGHRIERVAVRPGAVSVAIGR